MSKSDKPKPKKLFTKKTKTKLSFNKVDGSVTKGELVECKPLNPDNTQTPNMLKNKAGLDMERLGNIGKFVSMDDAELMSHVPKGGEGAGNKLTEDERDSRLVLVHRYHLRGMTNKEIAEKLDISTRMVFKIKTKIKELHKRSFTNVDLNEFLGETVAFFQEVRNMSMMLAGDDKCTSKEKIAALKVASDTEMNKVRFLDYCGVFAYIRGNATVMEDVINTVPESDKDQALAAMDEFALDLFSAN